MKRMAILSLLCFSLVWAQTAQGPAYAAQLAYFRFMLLGLANPDFSPDAIEAYQHALVVQYALNSQELLVITESAGTLHALLKQIKESIAGIVAGKRALRRQIYSLFNPSPWSERD
jgi:hypothetical protein